MNGDIRLCFSLDGSPFFTPILFSGHLCNDAEEPAWYLDNDEGEDGGWSALLELTDVGDDANPSKNLDDARPVSAAPGALSLVPNFEVGSNDDARPVSPAPGALSLVPNFEVGSNDDARPVSAAPGALSLVPNLEVGSNDDARPVSAAPGALSLVPNFEVGSNDDARPVSAAPGALSLVPNFEVGSKERAFVHVRHPTQLCYPHVPSQTDPPLNISRAYKAKGVFAIDDSNCKKYQDPDRGPPPKVWRPRSQASFAPGVPSAIAPRFPTVELDCPVSAAPGIQEPSRATRPESNAPGATLSSSKMTRPVSTAPGVHNSLTETRPVSVAPGVCECPSVDGDPTGESRSDEGPNRRLIKLSIMETRLNARRLMELDTDNNRQSLLGGQSACQADINWLHAPQEHDSAVDPILVEESAISGFHQSSSFVPTNEQEARVKHSNVESRVKPSNDASRVALMPAHSLVDTVDAHVNKAGVSNLVTEINICLGQEYAPNPDSVSGPTVETLRSGLMVFDQPLPIIPDPLGPNIDKEKDGIQGMVQAQQAGELKLGDIDNFGNPAQPPKIFMPPMNFNCLFILGCWILVPSNFAKEKGISSTTPDSKRAKLEEPSAKVKRSLEFMSARTTDQADPSVPSTSLGEI